LDRYAEETFYDILLKYSHKDSVMGASMILKEAEREVGALYKLQNSVDPSWLESAWFGDSTLSLKPIK
jgi:hypothetical protein